MYFSSFDILFSHIPSCKALAINVATSPPTLFNRRIAYLFFVSVWKFLWVKPNRDRALIVTQTSALVSRTRRTRVCSFFVCFRLLLL